MSVEELAGINLGAQDEVQEDEFAGYVDYFGFDEYETFYLPDGKQFITFKKLNEGDRQKYESQTQRDVAFNRRTDDARIKIDSAGDRMALILVSVTGWNMVINEGGKKKRAPFSTGSPGSTLAQWLPKANPKIVNDLYQAIRKANPFLMEEMTEEMIVEEIGRLNEMLVDVRKRESQKKD